MYRPDPPHIGNGPKDGFFKPQLCADAGCFSHSTGRIGSRTDWTRCLILAPLKPKGRKKIRNNSLLKCSCGQCMTCRPTGTGCTNCSHSIVKHIHLLQLLCRRVLHCIHSAFVLMLQGQHTAGCQSAPGRLWKRIWEGSRRHMLVSTMPWCAQTTITCRFGLAGLGLWLRIPVLAPPKDVAGHCRLRAGSGCSTNTAEHLRNTEARTFCIHKEDCQVLWQNEIFTSEYWSYNLAGKDCFTGSSCGPARI